MAERCGLVAIVGAPNAGKSTLVNALVGQKVAIVSAKPQTTRARLMGIAIEDDAQLMLVDTPGIFEPHRRLDRAMVAAAWEGATSADLIALVVDAKAGLGPKVLDVLETLKSRPEPKWLVLNKVDIADKGKLLVHAERLTTPLQSSPSGGGDSRGERERVLGEVDSRAARAGEGSPGLFDHVFMVSAVTGDGLPALKSALAAALPEGPWHFPEDQVSSATDRMLAAEVTREQLYLQLHAELPYHSAVDTERYEERADGSVEIHQQILVGRSSQRAIVLGKGGQRLKEIGARARAALGELLGVPVHLYLHVKVNPAWEEDKSLYRDIGLDWVD